jgi:hypothetical protein
LPVILESRDILLDLDDQRSAECRNPRESRHSSRSR